jgi:exopolyphosphatase/guanosine-5'-triphosphate,3'-diphosphate pyrophosphatase
MLQTTLASVAIASGQLVGDLPTQNPLQQIEQRVDELQKNILTDVRTLATIDIGSGTTKIAVAEVNCSENRILKTLLRQSIPVSLREDLATNGGILSPAIEKTLIEALQTLMREAGQHRPMQWTAVGTSVFRTAKNSAEFLERVKQATGLTVCIVPQVEEGEIGFSSAVGASGLTSKEVIAWDTGSGSFQITSLIDGKLEMYAAEFGFVPALELLFKLRNRPLQEQVNPVSLEEEMALIEAIKAALPPVKSWVSDRSKQVIGFGEGKSVFKIGHIATGLDAYNKDDLMQAIHKYRDKTDKELSHFVAPREVLVGIAFLYAVMDHCGIEECRYVYTMGGCEGLMVMPKYWE